MSNYHIVGNHMSRLICMKKVEIIKGSRGLQKKKIGYLRNVTCVHLILIKTLSKNFITKIYLLLSSQKRFFEEVVKISTLFS